MQLTAQRLLNELPPFRDEWVLVNEKQKVKDIVAHMVKVHKKYPGYYDKIAIYFDADTIKKVCKNLSTFCNRNIAYVEEPEETQTTGLPTGILTRQHCDCKGYASFCGGILDAINRLTGSEIKWWYRFASYDADVETPHHVFVVVLDENGEEIWIDPVPGAETKTPNWILDKHVNVKSMALYENIAGVKGNGSNYFPQQQIAGNAIGKASLTLTPRVNVNPLNWNYGNQYPGVFNPYLGISQYRDEGGDRNLNKDQIATELNALIQQGPSPGHTVDPDFVEWVYQTNLRSWNFYYADGVKPGFTAENLLPAGYPRLIITDDGRLTLDSDQKLDDYKNGEIHLLTAWAQALVNEFDPTPYPVKPEHIKIHSQMKEGNIETRNLFSEARGDSFFHEVGKALEGAVNFVKAGTFKILGSIPRNAFLGLVAINAFNMAAAMWNRIEAGQWEEMAKKWKSIGGNPDKLKGTIEDGKGKKAILGNTNAIGEPMTATALLAAAAPIIAVMLKFIDKDGKITEVLSTTKTFLQSKYPDIDLSAYGFLDKKTGKEIEWVVDDKDNEMLGGGNNDMPKPPGTTTNSSIMDWAKNNPIPAAGVIGLGALLLTKKKGQKPNYIIPLMAAAATYFMLTKGSQSNSTTTDKRAYLLKWITTNTTDSPQTIQRVTQVFQQMTEQEIADTYNFIFNYHLSGNPLPEGSLKQAILAISAKYDIFT